MTGETGVATYELRNAPRGTYRTVPSRVAKDGCVWDPSLDAVDPGHTR